MNALEDRLRRELRTESEQITPDSIPALRLRAHKGRRRRFLSLAHGGGERQGAALHWRGWLTSVAAAIVVAAAIAGSGALSHALFPPKAPGGHPSAAVAPIPSATAVGRKAPGWLPSPAVVAIQPAAARNAAVTWILHQVSPSTLVSCDAQLCTDLASRGFRLANLLVLGPSNDPLGSNLVVATATVRNRFGGRLAVWAPAVIASFGTGNARIDVRWCYPGGARAYRGALPAALRARKAAGTQLLTNSHITFSATARAQLSSGQVDPLLPLLLAAMAHSHPVRVVDFAGQPPGGGPASLLRWVDLATTVPGAHLTPAAYLGWMRSFTGVQRAEDRPAWVQQVTPRSRQAVLRIGYGAPSPLR